MVYREVRGLHQAAYVLAVFTFASQLLALVRDRLLAHEFGAGALLDLYYAAFRIPDLMFVVFASSLSVYVLIPFITNKQQSADSREGSVLLSQMFSVFLLVYSAVALLIAALAPVVVPLLFPGIADTDALVLLTRILLLQPFFLGLSSLLGVITQLGHRFVLYAVSPLLYNLGIIFGITVLFPWLGVAGLGLGVVLGAVGHMAIQVPFVARSHFSLQFTTRVSFARVREVVSVSLPRALTLSLNQFILLVFTSIASVLTVGSVSVFQFAYNLHAVPLAIIGASYSVAAFPVLAERYAAGALDAFRVYVMTALRHIIFWLVPIVALLIVLRAHVVRVVLGSGAFDWDDTRLTAAVLAMLALALVAHAIHLLVVRMFYAAGETRVPLMVAFLGALGAVALAVWLLVFYLRVPFVAEHVAQLFRLHDTAGAEVLMLPLAYFLALTVQVLTLLVVAARRFRIPLADLRAPLRNAVAAALAAGAIAYLILQVLVPGVDQATFIGIVLQGGVAGIGGVGAAVLMYFIVRSPEIKEISASLQRRFARQPSAARPHSELLE